MVKVDLRSFFNVNGENYTRVILLTISGILFSAAPAVWISLGYLDPLAWFLEWSDIILAISLMVASLKIQEREMGRPGHCINSGGRRYDGFSLRCAESK